MASIMFPFPQRATSVNAVTFSAVMMLAAGGTAVPILVHVAGEGDVSGSWGAEVGDRVGGTVSVGDGVLGRITVLIGAGVTVNAGVSDGVGDGRSATVVGSASGEEVGVGVMGWST